LRREFPVDLDSPYRSTASAILQPVGTKSRGRRFCQDGREPVFDLCVADKVSSLFINL
jgi:hypothetical protein